MVTGIDKAIAAVLTNLASLGVMFGLIPEGMISEPYIVAIATVITGIITWWVPNKEA